jgi:hypothetical protein
MCSRSTYLRSRIRGGSDDGCGNSSRVAEGNVKATYPSRVGQIARGTVKGDHWHTVSIASHFDRLPQRKGFSNREQLEDRLFSGKPLRKLGRLRDARRVTRALVNGEDLLKVSLPEFIDRAFDFADWLEIHADASPGICGVHANDFCTRTRLGLRQQEFDIVSDFEA